MANGTPDLSPDGLRSLVNQVTEIDEKLDAASGGESIAQKEIISTAVETHGDVAKKNVDKLFDAASQKGSDFVVALYQTLKDALDEKFKPVLKEFVEQQRAASATGDESIDIASLREQRKEVMEKYRTLRKVLEVYADQFPGFSEALAEISEPKKRGGGRPKGSTTSAAKQGVTFYVDDKKFSSFAQAASAATKDMDNVGRGKEIGPTKYLREQLKESGISSSGNQPYEKAPWEITVNGHVIRAEKDEASTEAS